ncbi:uncharacterized protein LOC117142057 [Drosophila mauritiana]|uniref:Uncharacterized protein LOC117142057 n=1 Tax=Drosophila mauritiana TaxID=7226 RepID=A0A6P8JXW8_DROMA|nr:uncharacterized protein LOC117142057 [Drosophila mauritiana]
MATITSAFPSKVSDDSLQAGSRSNSFSTNPNTHPVIASKLSELSSSADPFGSSFSSNLSCES